MAKNGHGRVTLSASHRDPPKGAKAAGKVAGDERVEVTVRLRRRPGAGVPTVGATPMSREAFRDAFGADPADIERVEQFADEHELDVAQTSIAERSIRLSGTAAAMEAAFGVKLKNYRVSARSKTFRGRTGTLTIPKDLAGIIEGVFGLDNRPQARPHFHIRESRSGRRAPRADAGRPMTPLEVAKLYEFPPELNGSGQCIAILELGGGYRTKDLTAYFKTLGIKKPKVSAISVAGAHNEPDGPSKRRQRRGDAGHRGRRRRRARREDRGLLRAQHRRRLPRRPQRGGARQRAQAAGGLHQLGRLRERLDRAGQA